MKRRQNEKFTSKLRTFGTFHNSISIPTQTLIRTIVFASLSNTYSNTIKLWNILKKTLRTDKPSRDFRVRQN